MLVPDAEDDNIFSLVTANIYTYYMKLRNNLLKYLSQFYDLIKEGRDMKQIMRLQSD